jgi:hypothetical protein
MNWQERFYFVIEWVKKYGGTYELVDNGKTVKMIFHNVLAPDSEYKVIADFFELIGALFEPEKKETL